MNADVAAIEIRNKHCRCLKKHSGSLCWLPDGSYSLSSCVSTLLGFLSKVMSSHFVLDIFNHKLMTHWQYHRHYSDSYGNLQFDHADQELTLKH